MALTTKFSIFPLILALIPILIQCAQSLDLESARELRCIKPPKTTPVDMQWMRSVKKWYFPLANRYDLYAFASDITDKQPKELNEDQVYYKSCLSWELTEVWKDPTFVVTGFGGLQKSYKLKPLDESFETFEFLTPDGISMARSYSTLTDNKTFHFTTSCFTELDEMSWAVASPYKSLPKETIKLIHEHALSLGFRREHFTGLRYDSCDDEDSQQDKNEL